MPTTKSERLRGARDRRGSLATLGAVPERAPVGNRARGLQRERRRLELLHARPGALARLSLGRGRARGPLRRQAAAVFRAGAVERRRSDPEGAAVRAHQQRGQSRRGREGVLLLSRLDADAFLPEVSLQVSAARLSVRRPGAHQPRAAARRAGVRAARHRRLRRRPVLRRVRRVREGVARGHPDPDHRVQPRTAGRDAARAADVLVPQHLDRAGRRPTARCLRRSPPADGSVINADACAARRAIHLQRGSGRAAVHRERDQYAAHREYAEPHAVREGRHQRLHRARSPRRCESAALRHEGGGALRDRRGGRAVARAAPAIVRSSAGVRRSAWRTVRRGLRRRARGAAARSR